MLIGDQLEKSLSVLVATFSDRSDFADLSVYCLQNGSKLCSDAHGNHEVSKATLVHVHVHILEL